MGQQPNIELDVSDAPRPSVQPEAPERWKPARPGEITSPADMMMGGAFGNPGPDTGWVLKLLRRIEFERESKEIEPVLASVASARASVLGRAPTPEDVEAALLIAGLRPEGLDAGTLEELAERRRHAVRHAAHDVVKGRSLLEGIDRDVLRGSLDDIRSALREVAFE
jgi:hypothetical protein